METQKEIKESQQERIVDSLLSWLMKQYILLENVRCVFCSLFPKMTI